MDNIKTKGYTLSARQNEHWRWVATIISSCCVLDNNRGPYLKSGKVWFCLLFSVVPPQKSSWLQNALRMLTSSAWEKWLKRFSDSHRIRHFHVAMIKRQCLRKIAKLVCIIPFIVATWKWRILKFSLNVFSHFSHAKLVKQMLRPVFDWHSSTCSFIGTKQIKFSKE